MEIRGNTIHRGEKSPTNQIFIHQKQSFFPNIRLFYSIKDLEADREENVERVP